LCYFFILREESDEAEDDGGSAAAEEAEMNCNFSPWLTLTLPLQRVLSPLLTLILP
jgi:hypothetical protein